MNLGSRGLSANARRSSEIERARTSSVTNASAHTVFRSSFLETGSPGFEARRTKTSITFGSSRTALPFEETVFSVGWTNHVPTRKSPFKLLLQERAQSSSIINRYASSERQTGLNSDFKQNGLYVRRNVAAGVLAGHGTQGHFGVRCCHELHDTVVEAHRPIPAACALGAGPPWTGSLVRAFARGRGIRGPKSTSTTRTIKPTIQT
jgi:hypothetical protein